MKSRTIAFAAVIASMLPDTSSATLNILVTESNRLLEYSPTGSLVRNYGTVPHPDTSRYDATDVVATPDGRIHVLNSAPFENDYLSTLSTASGFWVHTSDPAGGFGNVSDADLSIGMDLAISRRTAFDLTNLTAMQFVVSGFRDVGEVSFGLDGLVYALDSGSPRHGVRVLDPGDFSVIRELTLLDSSGFRLDARGIAVREDGRLFVADWDGSIYEFDATGLLLRTVPTGAFNLLDIDLSRDGTLILGSRFGDVVVTDTSFSSISRFSVGSGLTYVGFAVPEPGVVSLAVVPALLMLFPRRRRNMRSARRRTVATPPPRPGLPAGFAVS